MTKLTMHTLVGLSVAVFVTAFSPLPVQPACT